MKLRFVWDENKNKANIKKHGISFEEARTVFFNFPLEVFYDPEHSEEQDRYIAFGHSDEGRFLLVVHIENVTGTQIRIISARKATKKETNQFLEHKFGGL